MTLEEAIDVIDSRGITPWMAWGVIKWNDGYCIVTGEQMKRHPDLVTKAVYIKKGEAWPNPPVFKVKPLNIKNKKKPKKKMKPKKIENLIGRKVALIDLVHLNIDEYIIEKDELGSLRFKDYPSNVFLLTDSDELKFRKGEVAWIHRDEVQIKLI